MRQFSFTVLWANSDDEKLMIFFSKFKFPEKRQLCKLSSKELFCMKCQILISGENKKRYFRMLCVEFLTHHAKR